MKKEKFEEIDIALRLIILEVFTNGFNQGQIKEGVNFSIVESTIKKIKRIIKNYETRKNDL